MAPSIENPRRSPRLPIPCSARVALRSGSFFFSCTIDVGPGGCGLEGAASRIDPGERLFLEIEFEGTRHLLAGRVAWSSDGPPWRAGVAFDEGSRGSAVALYERLASAHPDLAQAGRGVERIPEDAVLVRTPVPGTLRAIPKEAEILRAIGEGLEARALPDRLGKDWTSYVNAVFALLERGTIEVHQPGGRPSAR